MCSSTQDFDIWLKGALEVESLSLCELCEGNLEGGLSCWGPWRICRKGSGGGQLFPKGPCLGKLEGLSTRDFERWMKGDLGWSLFLWRGTMEGAFTRDPGRYVKKGSTYGCFSPWGPLYNQGEPGIWRGGSRMPGTLKDVWRSALWMEHLSARDSMKRTMREGSFTGDPERYKQGSEMAVCFHRGPAFGEHGGALLP